MSRALAGKRGCGTRVAGGCYVECGTSENGVPIEFWLEDPPLDWAQIGKFEWFESHRAPIVVEHNGANHLVIWIGEEFYPNVFDFIEETRVLGASRRIPSGFDFSQITAGSRMILVHPRAQMDGTAIKELECPCPRHALRAGTRSFKPAHDSFEAEPHCIGAALYVPKDDVHGVANVYDYRSLSTISTQVRRIACGHTYRVFELPEVVQPDELKPKPAVFLQLPITGVCMVNQKDGSFDPKVEDRVRKAGVETFRADE
jgi:hypothetical protein